MTGCECVWMIQPITRCVHVQEGAPLKKKLDEIFESTRYTKVRPFHL